MSIIIPSTHIFYKNNPKIRNNFIDRVNIEQTIVSSNNEYDKPVFSKRFESNNVLEQEKNDQGGKIAYIGGTTTNWNYAFVYVNLKSSYGKFDIHFDRLKNNQYVNNIHIKDSNEKTEIRASYIGKTITTPLTAKIKYNSMQIEGVPYDLTLGTSQESDIGYIYLPPLSLTYQASHGTGLETATIEKTVSIADNDICVNSSTEDMASLSVQLRTDMLQQKLKYEGALYTPTANRVLTLTGEQIEYVITSVELTVNGDTIGIDLTDGTYTSGDGNNPFTVSRNELLQNGTQLARANYFPIVADNIMNEYSRGKETATVRCCMGDYYDEQGDKVIGSEGGINLLNKSSETNFGATESNGRLKFTARTDESMPSPPALQIRDANKKPVVGAPSPYGSLFENYNNTGRFYKSFYYSNDYAYIGALLIFANDDYTQTRQYYVEWDATNLTAGKRYCLSFIFEYDYDTARNIAYISKPQINEGETPLPYDTGKVSMLFSIGDQVIPMVRTVIGTDSPMSLKQDGVTAKTFEVCGIRHIYEGCPWQELSLKELS